MRPFLAFLGLLVLAHPLDAQVPSCEKFFLMEQFSRQQVRNQGIDLGPALETADISPELISEDSANVVLDFAAWAKEIGYTDLFEEDKELEWFRIWDEAVRFAAYLVEATTLGFSCHLGEVMVRVAADTLGWMPIPDCIEAASIGTPALRMVFIQRAVRRP